MTPSSLHVIGVAEKSDAMFTGVSALSLLRQRGDIQAATILDSLEKNDKWRRTFMEIHIKEAQGYNLPIGYLGLRRHHRRNNDAQEHKVSSIAVLAVWEQGNRSVLRSGQPV